MSEYHTIPGFSRYKIDAAGNILDTATGQHLDAITGTEHSFMLYDDAGQRLKRGLKRVYNLAFNLEFSQDTIADLPGEQWKPIKNTQGKYFVSNKGRVKSYCRYNAIIRKPEDNGKGYQQVKIQGKKYYIHRLVSIAFLGEPDPEKNTVHHRNSNRKDNDLQNLTFLSLADNVREAHARRKEAKENQ